MKTNGCITVNREVAKLLPRKTTTRRVIKDTILDMLYKKSSKDVDNELENILIRQYSKYKIGDILWIREPARIVDYKIGLDRTKFIAQYADKEIREFLDFDAMYESRELDYPKWFLRKQYIPGGCLKETARHFVKIISVRVERLQDITMRGIETEGFPYKGVLSSERVDEIIKNGYGWFKTLWNSTAPKGYKWKDNPFVFVYEWEYVK